MNTWFEDLVRTSFAFFHILFGLWSISSSYSVEVGIWFERLYLLATASRWSMGVLSILFAIDCVQMRFMTVSWVSRKVALYTVSVLGLPVMPMRAFMLRYRYPLAHVAMVCEILVVKTTLYQVLLLNSAYHTWYLAL